MYRYALARLVVKAPQHLPAAVVGGGPLWPAGAGPAFRRGCSAGWGEGRTWLPLLRGWRLPGRRERPGRPETHGSSENHLLPGTPSRCTQNQAGARRDTLGEGRLLPVLLLYSFQTLGVLTRKGKEIGRNRRLGTMVMPESQSFLQETYSCSHQKLGVLGAFSF